MTPTQLYAAVLLCGLLFAFAVSYVVTAVVEHVIDRMAKR